MRHHILEHIGSYLAWKCRDFDGYTGYRYRFVGRLVLWFWGIENIGMYIRRGYKQDLLVGLSRLGFGPFIKGMWRAYLKNYE